MKTYLPRRGCAKISGNKKPALGGLLHTVIKAARIALVTPNTPDTSIEHEKL